MSPARRSIRRRNWPRGLREPRPNYYTFDHPDGRNIAIGRVPLDVAINEVLAANRLIASQKPTLLEKLTGGANTVAQLLEKMDAQENKNTAKAIRSLDKKIIQRMGSAAVSSITTAQISNAIEAEEAAGKARSAQALRSRLQAVFRRALELGWAEVNPVAPTRNKKVQTKRSRLTLDTFKLIYSKAPEVAEWLPLAMRLALVTGADRSTIAGLQRSMVADGFLTYQRSKTAAWIAVPLRLRLDVMGWTLQELVNERTGVLSPYLVHHVKLWGNAPPGSKVHPDRISHAFAEARDLAGLGGENPPTFHEVRSLSVRLYKAQGNVDVQALMGHATAAMTGVYEDPRGVEAIRVKVG